VNNRLLLQLCLLCDTTGSFHDASVMENAYAHMRTVPIFTVFLSAFLH
jgi:hypothetical protein